MSDYPTALLGALCDAQTKITPVPKTAEMDAGKYGYHYADAASVVLHARRALHAEGLFVVFDSVGVHPGEKGRGVVDLGGSIFHRPSGESLPLTFALPYLAQTGRPDDKAAQAAITTGEARAYRLLLGLTTEDADHEIASLPDEPTPTEKPAAPPVPPAAKPYTPPQPSPAPAPKPAAKPSPVKEAAPDPKLIDEAPGTNDPADIAAFTASAERIGLSLDVAASWCSRVPEGALLKESPSARYPHWQAALAAGEVGQLRAQIDKDIEWLRSRQLHPKRSGWADTIKAWAADQLNF